MCIIYEHMRTKWKYFWTTTTGKRINKITQEHTSMDRITHDLKEISYELLSKKKTIYYYEGWQSEAVINKLVWYYGFLWMTYLFPNFFYCKLHSIFSIKIWIYLINKGFSWLDKNKLAKSRTKWKFEKNCGYFHLLRLCR